jgi:hypothetical protein
MMKLTLDGRAMTVRDVLRTEIRQLAMIAACVVFAALTVPVLLMRSGRAGLAVSAAALLVATYTGILVYRRTGALRCPRCNKSLGPAVFGAYWFIYLEDLERCPTCNLDLDRDLETIQTI